MRYAHWFGDMLERLPECLTPREFAELYGVKLRTVQNWIANGKRVGARRVWLQAFSVGGLWRIPREAHEQFLRDCNQDLMREIANEQHAERRYARRAQRRLERESKRREPRRLERESNGMAN